MHHVPAFCKERGGVAQLHTFHWLPLAAKTRWGTHRITHKCFLSTSVWQLCHNAHLGGLVVTLSWSIVAKKRERHQEHETVVCHLKGKEGIRTDIKQLLCMIRRSQADSGRSWQQSRRHHCRVDVQALASRCWSAKAAWRGITKASLSSSCLKEASVADRRSGNGAHCRWLGDVEFGLQGKRRERSVGSTPSLTGQ